MRVCTRLSYLVMAKYHKEPAQFGISITKDLYTDSNYPTIQIWKTIIYRRK